MAEAYTNPASSLERAFDNTYATALAAESEGLAWFGEPTTYANSEGGLEWYVPACRLDRIEQQQHTVFDIRGLQRRHSGWRLPSGTYHYETWDCNDTTAPHLWVSQYRDEPSELMPDDKEYPRPLNGAAVCGVFARLASSGEQLAYAAERFVGWAAGEETLTESFIGAVRTLVNRAFTLYEPIEAAPEPIVLEAVRTLAAALRHEVPPSNNMKRALGRYVGWLLVSDFSGHEAPRGMSTSLRHIPKDIYARAAEAFDEASLLPDDFWFVHGIAGRAAVTVPAVLPILYRKLPDETSWAGLDSIAAKPQQVTADYIAALFRRYADDEHRDGAWTKKALEYIRARSGKESSVNLQRLVDAANAVAASYNQELRSRPDFAASMLLPQLKNYDPVSYSDALLLLLGRTRSAAAPPHVVASQFDEDVMHAEVVAIVNERSRRAHRARAVGALTLQRPELTPDQLVTARKLAKQGLGLSDIVTALSGADAR